MAGAILLSASCTKIANYAEKRADRAAYANIREAQSAAFGRIDSFSLEDEPSAIVRNLLKLDRQAEETELLPLSSALAVAMRNSRSYRSRKEQLFVQALRLTETQKNFNWNYSTYAEVRSGIAKKRSRTIETFGDRGIDSEMRARAQHTLVSGARISLGFTRNIISYLSGSNDSSENNALSFNIVQPLLNGFGPLVTKEPLRQAERALVYAIRDFKRFQQSFVINIAAQYYTTLRARDKLYNEQKSYAASIANRKRSEAYAKAGRIADFEAAQARQSELNAADRWVLSRVNYRKALDDFHFMLSLPIGLNAEPDPGELQLLAERGMVELDISLADALKSAVSNRLDLVNRRQQIEDKDRRVEIQHHRFLPNLEVEYTAGRESGGASDINEKHEIAVRLDLPLDWTEKRNAYRIARINLEQEIRNLKEEEEDVRRNVRDLWHRLERNRSVYNNRLLSVKLSERRVENARLLLRQGKALTRDLLDAEDDLLSSRNDVTATLVDFTINRLRFWNAIESFEIDPEGMWYEQRNTKEAAEAP